jgi:hypothetical protein
MPGLGQERHASFFPIHQVNVGNQLGNLEHGLAALALHGRSLSAWFDSA